MHKIALASGAIFAALGVAIGAFGAHGLKTTLTLNNQLSTFETGVKYHMYHALGLLVIGILIQHFPHRFLDYSVGLMMGGIIIFSGSLYTLSITNIKILGAVTPIGGLAFIAAWILVLLGVLKTQ